MEVMSEDAIPPIERVDPQPVVQPVRAATPPPVVAPPTRVEPPRADRRVDSTARNEVLAPTAAQHQFDAAEIAAEIHDSAMHGNGIAQAIERAGRERAAGAAPLEPPIDAHERMLGGAAAVAGSGMTSVERGRAERPNMLPEDDLIPDVADSTRITRVRRRGDDPHDGKRQRRGEEER